MSSYIGVEPSTSFTGLIKQDFSVSATTSYTLSHSVNNANDIALFINFVRQEPTTAYSCSGTSLTLTSATAGSDDMYCIYLGQALQTVNPSNASVGNSQVAPSIITGQTNENTANDSDTILVYDDSATALRKQTRANFLSGVGGTNTPNFFAYLNANQSNFNDTSFTKVAYNAELFDTGNGFDTSTGTYTIPETGKYFFGFQVRKNNIQTDRLLLDIRINGSDGADFEHGTHGGYGAVTGSFIRSFSANDTVEAYLYQQSGATRTMRGGTNYKDSFFYGFKIIE